jgi:hypothetical protein
MPPATHDPTSTIISRNAGRQPGGARATETVLARAIGPAEKPPERSGTSCLPVTQVLPGQGSSAAPSICAFVDVSRSTSPIPTGFAPGGGVATGDPPSTASSAEPAARRNHRLIRSRLVLTCESELYRRPHFPV